MSWIWPILAILVIILWTAALIDIVRRRHQMSGVKIAIWVLVLILFPILGVIAYFVVHSVGGAFSGAPRDEVVRDAERPL
jgi:hypothetical protein